MDHYRQPRLQQVKMVAVTPMTVPRKIVWREGCHKWCRMVEAGHYRQVEGVKADSVE